MAIPQPIYANFINTTLVNPLSSGGTSITLASSANLPTLSAGQTMTLVLNDAATRSVFEVVQVTAITGAVCTVVRAQEGTTAVAWNVGDYAFSPPTAGILTSLLQKCPPVYTLGGGLLALEHPGEFAVIDSIVATGSSTTITFTQAFTTGNVGFIFDATAGTFTTGFINELTSFTFTSVNGHTYGMIIYGY